MTMPSRLLATLSFGLAMMFAAGSASASPPPEKVRIVVRAAATDLADLRAHGELVTPAGLGKVGVQTIEVPGSAAPRVLDALRHRFADAQLVGRLEAARTPNDPNWSRQWGSRLTRTDRAWNTSIGRSDVVVAILDTGVDDSHRDLAGAVGSGYDFVGDDPFNPFDEDPDPHDENPDRHGTHTALVAGARANNGLDGAGYCWSCRIMPVRVLDEDGFGYTDELAAGIVWATDHGADVINMSLAAYNQLPPLDVQAAVDYASAAGVVLTAAAGNMHGTYGAAGTPSWPAAFEDVIGVAASDANDKLYSWSSRGDWVDVSAPGCHATMKGIDDFCGTSAAAPAVAGSAGLVLAATPRADGPLTVLSLRVGARSTSANVRYGRHDSLGSTRRVLRGQPVLGDWDDDGRDTPGWFHDGRWWFATGNGVKTLTYGRRGDVPVVGDWDGDGDDTIGIVRNGRWHLRDRLGGGSPDRSFTYGRVADGDVPLVGDWDGKRGDTIGIVRNGRWHLRNKLAGGVADVSFTFGRVLDGDVPLVGDWDGDGDDTIGVVRNGRWHLKNKLKGGVADVLFTYGRVVRGDVPVPGDFDGDGDDTPGITRAPFWHLRNRLGGGSAHDVLRH